MHGFLFYWTSWIFWIVITFFMKKSSFRTMLACWLLIVIITSTQFIYIGDFYISVSTIILVLGAILLISVTSNLYYHIFCALTISVGYSAMLFFEQISPVWIFVPRVILYSILLAIIIRMIGKYYYAQLAIGILGMITGEALYRVTLIQYGISQIVGEFYFLDTLSCVLLIISFLDILQRGRRKLSNKIQSYQ